MNVKTKRGFTLIELMIVVAIIGILAAIAIPKFSQLITKGNEANTKGNLGAMRSALSIYYGDTEGSYPTDALGGATGSLTSNNKYMNVVPFAKLPAVAGSNAGHTDSANVTLTTADNGDVGGWAYDNSPADSNWGRVLVSCSHKDSKSQAWTSY